MNQITDLPFAQGAQATSAVVGRDHAHESAQLHVAGTATYIDDLPELAGTLHAALGAQIFARARWAFEAQARGLFAPQPARFEVRGGEAVYTTSRFGFQLALAWGWRFL